MLAALLLQNASGVPTWPNLLVGGMVAVFSFFTVRLITQIDKKLDDNCTAVAKISADMQGYKMLIDHLKAENTHLGGKVDTLTNSFAKIDKFIAVQMALHKINIPEN